MDNILMVVYPVFLELVTTTTSTGIQSSFRRLNFFFYLPRFPNQYYCSRTVKDFHEIAPKSVLAFFFLSPFVVLHFDLIHIINSVSNKYPLSIL